MVPRLRLRTHLTPLALGDGVVQLGADPRDAIMLEGLTDAEVGLLDLLDGRVDPDHLPGRATPHGLVSSRAAELIDVLKAQDALQPVIGGSASVAAVGDRRLTAAFLAEIAACGMATSVGPGTVTVAVSHVGAPPPAADGPTLAVALGPRRFRIGPFTPADQGWDDPCPECVPVRLLPWIGQLPLPPHEVLLGAAGLAAPLLRRLLAGEPVPVGVTYEVDLAHCTLVQRAWPRDPHCPACGHPPTGRESGRALALRRPEASLG